jgi:hypothetical protein
MVIFQTKKHIDVFKWERSNAYGISIFKASNIRHDWEISISFWRYEIVIYLYNASCGSEVE